MGICTSMSDANILVVEDYLAFHFNLVAFEFFIPEKKKTKQKKRTLNVESLGESEGQRQKSLDIFTTYNFLNVSKESNVSSVILIQ